MEGEKIVDTDEASESYGPKTAEMPDLTEFPSSCMKEFIDVGSLPDYLHEKAWNMIKHRVKAFGFDGRLGHLKTKVHIQTQDGQVPISVPMYGSSPEKRCFMDVQIDTWFEQGIIEPSVSPWSAPVVIAYRNGKPWLTAMGNCAFASTIGSSMPLQLLTSFQYHGNQKSCHPCPALKCCHC